MLEKYDPRTVEPKWQSFWEKNKVFKSQDTSKKPKYYALDMFPYPSGAGLHVGHPLGYTATDIVSRKKRMEGFEVLHPMGWDAFGLPAENYAIKTGVHPDKSTRENMKTFKRQIQSLGLSYDWDREIGTCLPDYYRWTQWFFRFLYEKNLAYKKKAPVNWCEGCATVLANEQVVDGACERCKTKVIQKNLEQWFFRVTDFVEDQKGVSGLLSGLEKIDWPESTKINQRNWIGRSEGCNVAWKLSNSEIVLETYTTTVDTIFGVTFAVISQEHPQLEKVVTDSQKLAVKNYIESCKNKSELERTENKDKTGIDTGGRLIHPFTKQEIPLFVADYVLMNYGTGVVMGVPAHDQRDMDFAQKYELPLKVVIKSKEGESIVYDQIDKYAVQGILSDSGDFSGLEILEAREKIIDTLVGKNEGERKIQYRLRDWLISRQRYWGAPIPVVYDDQGKDYLIPDDELPVHLPEDVDFRPHGESPLCRSKKFHDPKDLLRIEKKLKEAGILSSERKIVRRESDTMDTFVCSSWYMWRFMDPKNEQEFCSKELANHWGPIDLYVGGAEHTVLHLLYARFFCKVLKRYGIIDYDEPFSALRHQGMILGEDGQKMSKSKGNVINPDLVVEQYGADTLRCYEMFMGPFNQMKPWSMASVQGTRRWLDRVWRVFEKIPLSSKSITPQPPLKLRGGDDLLERSVMPLLHQTIKMVGEHIDDFRFNTAISQLMILTNALTELESVSQEVLRTFALLLAPFAPHLAEEAWESLGEKELLAFAKWPTYDPALLVQEEVIYAIQVNGKLRGELKISKDASKEAVIAEARIQEKVQKHLEGVQIVKEIFVPGKIVGFVVK